MVGCKPQAVRCWFFLGGKMLDEYESVEEAKARFLLRPGTKRSIFGK